MKKARDKEKTREKSREKWCAALIAQYAEFDLKKKIQGKSMKD